MCVVCLCNNTTANKIILVSNEVSTCQNITVKISRPGFKSSAWPFYQEYEKKLALTTSTSARTFFSAGIKTQKQWDCDNQLRCCFLALSYSDSTFMLFHLAVWFLYHSWSLTNGCFQVAFKAVSKERIFLQSPRTSFHWHLLDELPLKTN